METAKLVACMQRLLPAQAVFITFNKDGIGGLSRLLRIVQRGHATFSGYSLLLALAIERSQDWEFDTNRTVGVRGMNRVSGGLLEEIALHVEKVAVADHGAKAIFTTNVWRREEAQATIVRAVITDALRAEVEALGLGIYADGANPDGIPALEFTIRDNDMNVLTSVTLDGWSGRMATDGEWGDFLYVDSHQLIEAIQTALNRYLDKVTATA